VSGNLPKNAQLACLTLSPSVKLAAYLADDFSIVYRLEAYERGTTGKECKVVSAADAATITAMVQASLLD
jgi:hypothetical protein